MSSCKTLQFIQTVQCTTVLLYWCNESSMLTLSLSTQVAFSLPSLNKTTPPSLYVYDNTPHCHYHWSAGQLNHENSQVTWLVTRGVANLASCPTGQSPRTGDTRTTSPVDTAGHNRECDKFDNLSTSRLQLVDQSWCEGGPAATSRWSLLALRKVLGQDHTRWTVAL